MIKLAFDFIFSSRLFIPTYAIKQFGLVSEIAKRRGTQLIIFDKDDTITLLKQFKVKDQNIKTTLQTLKQMNIKQIILSNSIKDTDPHEMEGIEIMRLRKKKPYNEQEVQMIIKDFQPQKVMIIGDRLMTDIYLANKLGIASILVPPAQQSTIKKHGLAVKILRDVQNIFLKMKGII